MSKVLVALALAGLAAGCSQPEAPVEAEPAPIQVQAAAVRRGEIAVQVEASGETAALREQRITSPVGGRVTLLQARPGDSLRQGEVAARVLPLENEAGVNGFGVLHDAGALSPEDSKRAQHLAAELRQHDIALRVPFAAQVANRLHNAGEYVAANEVLLEVFDPQSIYVLCQVPIDAPVRVGMPVDVFAGADAPVRAKVAALQTTVTPQALTLPLRIELDEPLQRPLLHAAVRCRVTVARHPDTLLIPRRALLSEDGEDGPTVMIVEGDRTRRRRVRTGLRDVDRVEVIEGLAEGDMVLIDGHYAVPDGSAVAVQTAPLK